VGIARALLVDAPVVLLDEPTAGLDVTAEELVVQALTRLVEDRTVIMTTHQPALTRLATRTVHLHRCGVLEEAPPLPTERPPAQRPPDDRPSIDPVLSEMPATAVGVAPGVRG
jgi:energy-coupling factor transporter ATP-binding protein EcfA2